MLQNLKSEVSFVILLTFFSGNIFVVNNCDPSKIKTPLNLSFWLYIIPLRAALLSIFGWYETLLIDSTYLYLLLILVQLQFF